MSDNRDEDRIHLGGKAVYDTDLLGTGNVGSGYVNAIETGADLEEDEEDMDATNMPKLGVKQVNAPAALLNQVGPSEDNYDPFAETRRDKSIASRENEYRQKRLHRQISPERHDPFADGGKTPDARSQTYAHIMHQQNVSQEITRHKREINKKIESGEVKASDFGEVTSNMERKKKRIDLSGNDGGETPSAGGPKKKMNLGGVGAISAATPKAPNMWDETPGRAPAGDATPNPNATPRIWDATPAHPSAGGATPATGTTPGTAKRNRWDATPRAELGAETPGSASWGTTPRADRGGDKDDGNSTARARKSRWDQTPRMDTTPNMGGMTPGGATPGGYATPGSMTPGGATPKMGGSTPGGATPMMGGMTPGGSTPIGTPAMGMATPAPGKARMGMSDAKLANNWATEIDERNRPMTDEELDAMLPPGYKVLDPPAGYAPIRTPSRKVTATPTPMNSQQQAGFFIQEENEMSTKMKGQELQTADAELPMLKPDDMQYFDKLLIDVDENALSPEEVKERRIMKLLLKIKNGTPPMRKSALRQITDRAREFGAGPLLNQILPLLMSPTLEDQERHLLVKVIDRILYKLDDLVRPYVHKILVVIEPLLIDEDYYARVEGREIISNLAKAAGLATMISTMRPDIDNIDEYVRNTTARAFAVVATALGIPSLLPFLKAVCRSKKSWQARHTGIKIVQQIAISMGCGILPHLKNMVEIIENGLEDEQQKVRTITALALAALAEAAHPYGIESFDSVLKPLWKGIRTHRGKGLAAFLKAIGYIIPLMDAEYANYYTREVMLILIREFASPDEEMKKIVLKVVKQCCGTDGVDSLYIKEDILPPFFKAFWNHRMALDRRNYKQCVETTVEIAKKVGSVEILNRIVDDLKDENEQYRKMVMETVQMIMQEMGSAEVDSRLEEQLIDGILYAFQEQTQEDATMLAGFGAVVNSLGKRVKTYLPQICGTVLWRLNNKSAKVRQQAADLISKIANVMKLCQEEKLMGHLGVVLYEYLGEEYPEVLGSILGALKAIVNVIGMHKMTPPIKDLLPRLTPILKNRHEKVQENCIDLVGRIADRGAEYVSAREWMRICFELLDLLKAHKKSIRRATVNTFGYIAKAIGPHDVLATLLNNLKVQERQLRVCTTIAIAIVAETCSPFTVLPGLMNEYRVPELNVQNGVLKALSFLFEYIGEMGKDYIYAVTPLFEDALQERDLVHRQIATAAISHMTIGVAGFGCEDALNHLLNYVWPNIFENSPHVCQAVHACLEGMRVSLGPIRIMQYALQGLFHPARRVRECYWRIYNNLYLGAQDAMVPAFPRVPDDEKNQYVRYELEYHL